MNTEPVSEEQQQALIRQYDAESNFRKLAGPVAVFVTIACVVLSVFHVYTAGFGLLVEIKHRTFHLAMVLALVFLIFPRPSLSQDRVKAARSWLAALMFAAFYCYLAWDLVARLSESGELKYGWAYLLLVVCIAVASLPIERVRGRQEALGWFDWPFAIVAAGVSAYLLVFFDDVFVARVGSPIAQDYLIGVLAIIMVMEATRRTMGPMLPAIGMACLLYALFGRYMPGVLAHRGYTVVRLVNHIYVGTEGIYGIAVGVVATYVFHFVLFGVLAHMTGLGKLFMDLATIAAGRYSGGPAKVCVVSSGMFGMISGSAVANAVTTGALTIPMMKKYGFSPRFAAAIEASASCGGQVTPPVMGASAFVMAELLNIPYKELAIIAIIPALFHYLACLTMVHLEARRLGLKGVEAELIPKFASVIKRAWHLFIPLIALVSLLLLDFTPFLAAFWGIILSIVCSYIPPLARRVGLGDLEGETLTPRRLVKAFEEGAKSALAIGAVCACVGLILGTLTLSGLGFKFSGAVVDLSAEVAQWFVAIDFTGLLNLHGAQVFFGLLFVAIACIMMGTGIPTTPTYIILASIAAPALVKLGVPLVATHFFVFYYGVLADVTPPVAMAAYAAAGIAGSEPVRTGLTAFRLSMGKALVPFMFVYTPSLLFIGFKPLEFVMALASGIVCIIALSAAYIGYFRAPINTLAKIVLTLAPPKLPMPHNMMAVSAPAAMGATLF